MPASSRPLIQPTVGLASVNSA